MVLFQSLCASVLTMCITEICKFSLLKTTGDPQKTILYSSVFGYTIAYIAQRYIFNSIKHTNPNNNTNFNFFSISLVKYIAVSSISVQLFSKILKTLLDIEYIKNIINNPNITPSRKRTYQYIIINISIFIVFLCIDFPMRKYFIFAKYTDNDYIFSYILYYISLMLYLYTHTEYNELKPINTTNTTNTINMQSKIKN